MADVEVTYKGNKIVELSESGSKILKTSGKYCEDDLTIDYAKSSTIIDSTVNSLYSIFVGGDENE